MTQTMEAHWLTFLIISFALLITPMYWFLILSNEKARIISWVTAIIAGLLLTADLFNLVGKFGPLGGALIGCLWITFPVIIWIKREWFKNISQKPLIGLQIFRIIGSLFLLEMVRGNIPASFAIPAGIGDIIVGLVALGLVLRYRQIPKWGVLTVIILGVADFISAFFWGFTSSQGPAQLFAIGFNNKLNLFPTGLIPMYLVPYAISFHLISLINLKKQ